MPNPERERIRILHQQLLDHQSHIRALLESKSWKITGPLRWLGSKIMRLFPSINSLNRNIETQKKHFSSFNRDTPKSSIGAPSQYEAKHAAAKLARTALEFFLSSRTKLILPSSSEPKISVLIVAYNRAELTLRCLLSLVENAPPAVELIIVNNGSYDETPDLLNQIEGAHVIHNEENLHFIAGANQAARQAHGEYILFLNNDTQLLPGSIQSALNTIESSPDIGAVGAKLILSDGSLQEAGSILWRDGSCVAYGRGDDPFASQYMFMRDTDFCSAAFLLTNRKVFLAAGGFDEAYKPAYYEDADYCLKLWKRGMRVVYDPNVALIHHEFGSSSSMAEAIQLQNANRQIFVTKHAEELSNQPDSKLANLLEARTHLQPRRKVLFIDDRVPHPSIGSGFPRAHAILLSLRRLNCFVTCYPMFFINEDWSSVYTDIPEEIEVILGAGHLSLLKFLDERKDFYDAMIVSRPPNMEIVQQLRQRREDLFQNVRFFYDSEALFSMRDVNLRRAKGEEVSEEEVNKLVRKEMALAEGVDAVLSASHGEQKTWVQYGLPRVQVLGHCVTISPTSLPFSERKGFLFVGSIHDDLSPNADAIRWFVRDIFPLIQIKLGPDTHVTIVGLNESDSIAALAGEQIRIVGYVEDLTEIYDQARVFVAPTRYSAGIPIKILNAASQGLPVVATSLLGGQLGWKNEEELLLTDTAETFAENCVKLYSNSGLWLRIRENALNRVITDCSQESFDQVLRNIIFA